MVLLFFWPEAWGGVAIRGLMIRSIPATFLCSRRAVNAAANTQPEQPAWLVSGHPAP